MQKFFGCAKNFNIKLGREFAKGAFVFVLILSLLFSQSLLLLSVQAASSPWTQTDWSGGSGQTNWLDATKFDSSSSVTTSTAGQVTLQATGNWYNTNWAYRRKITLDNSAQAENLVNFPVLVKLNSTRINYANTQNAGQDIRFTDSDGTTLLSYEIEKWDETGNSFVWVKIPQIDASSNTDYIYLYYGNASATDDQSATSVWDSSYKAVWHLKESGNGTANEYVDSTSNANHGQGGGGTASMTPALDSSGQIGSAQAFDGGAGDDDRIQTALAPSGYSAITMSAWVKLNAVDVYPMLISYGTNAEDNPEMRFNATTGRMELVGRVDNAGVVDTVNLAGAGWHYFVGVSNGTTLTLYKDGAIVGTPAVNTTGLNSTTPFRIGRRSNDEGGNFTIPGSIDEVRVSNSVRSAAWIAASYKSESDTFATYASEESVYAATPGTLTSSIFDAESPAGAAWGTLTYNATTPANTSVSVKARTSNSSSMTGATVFSSCTAITSGSDISSNNCVTDSHRYVQYELTLANTDSVSTPTFQDISIAFNAIPSAPSSLGPTSFVDGSWIASTTPTLQFTQSDADAGATVKFTIQISSTSDYSAPVVDYTSGLLATGTAQFLVGQATSIDNGTYAAGQAGQTLSDNSYYWRVMSTDNGNATSSWSVASSSIAFKVDATAPANVGIHSITADSSSALTVTASTSTDAGSGLHATPYWIDRDNGIASSSWQTSTVWQDTGLGENTQYTYKVKARDALGNESAYSATSSKYTLADAPTGLAASETTASAITLSVDTFPNATASSSGYFFENTTNSANSGWMQTNSWQNTGLSCGNSYSYTVKYRNGDGTETATAGLTVNTSACPAATTPSSGGGGGGGGQWTPPFPIEPEGGFKFFITQDITADGVITLNFDGGPDAEKIAISDNPNFSPAAYINNSTSTAWTLSGALGEKTLYVKFSNTYGRYSRVLSDTVRYVSREIAQAPNRPTTPIVEKIPKMLRPFVPEFLKPKQPEQPPHITIEDLVPREAPLAFQGKRQLLPAEPIRKFVLAPLPTGIRNLAQKFPALEKTLEDVGVGKMTDVAKLKTVTLTLPGLTERAGLPTAKVEPGKFALPQGVPVAQLSPAVKQQLPTEIVFAKTGGELIDFSIDLSVSDQGEPQQKIATISGKPLQLVVKPDKPVKSVKGYVVFKPKDSQPTSLALPLNSLLASVMFSNPVFAKPHDRPVRVEEKLVLLEFKYTDPDGDGIYTAEIQAPLVAGEYEIITVMDFNDPELGEKEIHLITVIDPEGYVYERDGDKETRIPGAIISLFWLNPETKQYELWPAKEYQQENPQTTDVRGTYSFLVPEGYYYIKAETPGYLAYDGKPFQVKEGSGVHINIELKTKYWWLNIVDWKTILLVVIIILLLYNFYRDKIRERLVGTSK